jgi:hypothetical protein
VYGILPKNGWLVASIVIMLIHQIVAYALCEHPSPLFPAVAPLWPKSLSGVLQPATEMCARCSAAFGVLGLRDGPSGIWHIQAAFYNSAKC